MKKILLITFLLFTNSLFGAYKVVSSGKIYCATVIKNMSDTTVRVSHQDHPSTGLVNHTITKESITFLQTGYIGYDGACNRDTVLFPQSYDLYNEVMEIDIDSKDSDFYKKMQSSTNIKKDLYYVKAKNDSKIICTAGNSTYWSGRYYKYFSPSFQDDTLTPDQNLVVATPSDIEFSYQGSSLNLDTGECIAPTDPTPVDVTEHFNKSNSFSSSYGQITTPLINLNTLFQNKNNLPNQNSLENKFDIDTTSSSQNCNNSLYNLQEKLLCEMNAGIRKLNQESNPKYSLNNLISILITSNDKNAQDTNESIKSISAFEEVRLQKQKDTNTLLDTTVAKQNELNTTLANIETTLKGIETNTTGGIVSGGGSTGGTVTPEPSEPLNLDKYFKPDETANIDDLNSINNDTDSIITTLFSSFTDFKTNVTVSIDSINNQLDGLKDSIQNPTNIFSKVNIINCPVTYQADFSAFGIGKKVLILDYCEFTSRLQPIVYFFTYVSLFLGLIFFSFRFIGVLI